jgi:hypothetical protein
MISYPNVKIEGLKVWNWELEAHYSLRKHLQGILKNNLATRIQLYIICLKINLNQISFVIGQCILDNNLLASIPHN